MTWHKFSIYALANLMAIALFELLLVFLPLGVYDHRNLSFLILIGGGLSIACFPFLAGKKPRGKHEKTH